MAVLTQMKIGTADGKRQRGSRQVAVDVNVDAANARCHGIRT